VLDLLTSAALVCLSRPHVPTTVQEDSEGEEDLPTISSAGARGDIRSQLAGVSGTHRLWTYQGMFPSIIYR